jgi:hypothetical protein
MLATHRRFRCQAASVLVAVIFAFGASPSPAAEPSSLAAASPHYAIHIDHEATADMLRRVLDGAREALVQSRCQQVLDEFSDLEGVPLRARLNEVGQAPDAYLGLIIFYDGRKHPRCGQRNILAVTHIGSRVVHICPEHLAARARHNPRWTEATLIHEALHTLGLGENPPSSQEITKAVMRQCE